MDSQHLPWHGTASQPSRPAQAVPPPLKGLSAQRLQLENHAQAFFHPAPFPQGQHGWFAKVCSHLSAPAPAAAEGSGHHRQLISSCTEPGLTPAKPRTTCTQVKLRFPAPFLLPRKRVLTPGSPIYLRSHHVRPVPLGNKHEAGSSTGRDTCQQTLFVPATAERSQGERTQCHRLLSARAKLALTLQRFGEGVSEGLTKARGAGTGANNIPSSYSTLLVRLNFTKVTGIIAINSPHPSKGRAGVQEPAPSPPGKQKRTQPPGPHHAPSKKPRNSLPAHGTEQPSPESQREQGPRCHLPPSHGNKRSLVILPCTTCAGRGGKEVPLPAGSELCPPHRSGGRGANKSSPRSQARGQSVTASHPWVGSAPKGKLSSSIWEQGCAG